MAQSSKKLHKKKFTWINLLQLLTVIALLAYMQVAVDTGRVQKVFLASPTSIVQRAWRLSPTEPFVRICC